MWNYQLKYKIWLIYNNYINIPSYSKKIEYLTNLIIFRDIKVIFAHIFVNKYQINIFSVSSVIYFFLLNWIIFRHFKSNLKIVRYYKSVLINFYCFVIFGKKKYIYEKLLDRVNNVISELKHLELNGRNTTFWSEPHFCFLFSFLVYLKLTVDYLY